MVKYVNDPQFQGLATKEQISDFNNRIARKIRYYYYYFDPTNEPSGIRMFGFKTRSSPLIAECQQKVAMFLALSQIDFIKYTEFTPTISYSDHDNNLNSAMIKAIQFIFNESDYHDDKFMNLIISYMYNANTCVSKHSHEIWDKFYKKDSKFIDILLNRIPLLVDDNQVYCCVRLLFASIEANLEFTAEQYEKMEYIAFLCLAWHLPDIRACGIHLLGKTKREISTILFSNKNLLIKRMKLKLKRYSIHHYNQDAEISLSAIYNSYYYDLWTLFLYELMQFFIEKGHKNIMENIQKLLDRNYSANRGYLIFYINTFYFQQNEEFQEIPDPQNQPEETENERIVVEILHKLMTSGKREFQHNVITAIPLVHKSLVIPCLQTLAMVEEEDIQDATKALLMFINNIGCQIINGEHQAVILPLIIQFLSILHNYFIHVDINSPRVIKWDKQHEELVLKNLNFIIGYCRIIHSSFNSNAEISDDVWPSPSRDLMFRFLINWAMTKSDKLQQLRNNAITAMSTMVKVGAIFNDAILFDSVILNLFGRIERRTKNFFSSLLYYHLELLLETFIDACFTQPRQISDLYINAIIRSATKHQIVYMLSGPMLLLAFVLKHINHPKADEFLNLFLKISLMRPRKPISYDALAKKLKTESYLDLIPEYCSYATEAIFHTGFKLLQQKTISISVSDICKAMTPWITNLRLLPKQSSCTLTSTKHFNYFTPYNFLVKMIETTEKSDDDGFAVLVPLWTELMKSPDHRELVLLFLINWRKSDTKKRIFTILRKDESIVQRLCMNISFAYYYHTTESQKRNFSNEIWVVPIIFDAFKTKWDLLEEHLIDVIHFVFLFNEDDTHDFFSFICEQFNIDDVDPIAAVKPFLEQVNPEEWGNEALKWIIGCRNLNLVLRSFKIYNQILKPIDSDIAKLIAKTVLFHLKTNEDTKLLNDLIAESFFFFAAAFQDNELYSLQYLMCFIDSPYYKTISTQLLVKVLTSRKTSGQSWPSIIGMVDPLLTKIEDNEQIQKLFELFLKTTHNEELMMLVAPIKKNNPALFPSSLTFDKLFSTVSESIMCKVLPKYARMMTSASRSLMDSIFEISSMILDKIVDENNYPSLSQIYKFALHTLLECPHSITFLNILNQKAANVSSLSIPDNLEYERNLDDVQRALERLPQFVETSFNSITDCKTFLSVANFLDVNVSPTILPFGAQQEMVDGMIRTSQTIRMKKTASLKKLNAQQSSAGMSFRSGMMGFVPILKVSQDTVLKPLFHPTALLPREKVCSEIPDADLIMDEADFLRSIDL